MTMIDEWLTSENLLLVAMMNLAAAWGATQPLNAVTTVNPVVVWIAIAATALVLLGYRVVIL
jgi:uncharacterized membrane protein